MRVALAKEMSAGRHKARKLARRFNPTDEVPKEVWTGLAWLLGGAAVLGTGVVVYNAVKAAPSAPTPAPAPAAPGAPGAPGASAAPGAPPVLPPAIAPTTAPGAQPTAAPPGTPPSPPSPPPPAPPPITPVVTWTSGNPAWAPPSEPAHFPAPVAVDTDVSSNSMLVAMAQAAMTQIAAAGATLGSGTFQYTGGINGAVDSGFVNGLTTVQAAITSAMSSGTIIGTTPHTNGTLDLKTLGVLIIFDIAAQLQSNPGSLSQSTYTTDSQLTILALQGVRAMIGHAAPFSAYVANIGAGAPLATALWTFQSNINGVFGQQIFPQLGQVQAALNQGNVLWTAWGYAVGVAA